MTDRNAGASPASPAYDPPAPAPTPEVDERRDSLRIALPMLVREVALGGSFEPRDGNLALGGVYFEALHPPVGSRIDVRFLLPGVREEVRAGGEVLRVTREAGERFGVHVKFVNIPLEAELAIARFLEGL
jgi:hypothetical protein